MTSGDRGAQPRSKQGQTEQGAWGWVQLGCISKDGISTGSRGHLFCHPHSEQEFPHAQREFRGFQFVLIVPCPARGVWLQLLHPPHQLFPHTLTRSLHGFLFSWLHSPSSPSLLYVSNPKTPLLLHHLCRGGASHSPTGH